MEEHCQLVNRGSREENLRCPVTAIGDEFSAPCRIVFGTRFRVKAELFQFQDFLPQTKYRNGTGNRLLYVLWGAEIRNSEGLYQVINSSYIKTGTTGTRNVLVE